MSLPLNISPLVTSDPSSVSAVLPTGNYTTDSKMSMDKMKVWIFVVLAIVVIIILCWIAKNYKCVSDALNTGCWCSNPLIGGILLFIALLITAWFTSRAFVMADSTTRNFLMVGFVAISILLILAFFLFYKKSNYSAAFYVSLLIVAVAFLHMYFCFKVNKNAGYAQLPLVIMTIVLACYFYNITANNENGCGPIECDDDCSKSD